jgi:hypothetical protein
LKLAGQLAVIAILCGPWAAEAASGKLATPNPGPAGIEWRPMATEMGLVLTVSGPQGVYLRQEVAPGQAVAFSIFDAAGQMRPAGTYVYELRPVPQIDEATRAELAAARENGGEAGALLKEAGIPAMAVQHGAFAIQDGAILMGGEPEPGAGKPAGGNRLATKDQVIPDDLIVQGSICAGLDCVNNESFGFDTIRMKENNTRIDFTDTSTTTGFPTQDWEIAANDSASGGRNALIVSDENTQLFVIESGNSANAIYIDDTARVGFRTSNPVLDIHISTSNTPGRLEQTSAGGFTAQTWDIAGNEANFFVRDVTGGSLLPFRIRPGAPTSSIDISADGDVGIGTASPDERLHVFENTNANTLAVVENSNTGADAVGVVRALSDVTTVNFQAHGSGRTIARFGKTLGGWGELLHAAGNGLIIGTLGAQSVILGTNNTNVLELTSTGSVLHKGATVHPDYVFGPDYELESIEEHATYMWKHKHLPAVGPGRYDEDGRAIYELGESRAGMLEELEKAHIFIEQLHGTIRELEAEAGEKDELLVAVQERLARLEAALAER